MQCKFLSETWLAPRSRNLPWANKLPRTWFGCNQVQGLSNDCQRNSTNFIWLPPSWKTMYWSSTQVRRNLVAAESGCTQASSLNFIWGQFNVELHPREIQPTWSVCNDFALKSNDRLVAAKSSSVNFVWNQCKFFQLQAYNIRIAPRHKAMKEPIPNFDSAFLLLKEKGAWPPCFLRRKVALCP